MFRLFYTFWSSYNYYWLNRKALFWIFFELLIGMLVVNVVLSLNTAIWDMQNIISEANPNYTVKIFSTEHSWSREKSKAVHAGLLPQKIPYTMQDIEDMKGIVAGYGEAYSFCDWSMTFKVTKYAAKSVHVRFTSALNEGEYWITDQATNLLSGYELLSSKDEKMVRHIQANIESLWMKKELSDEVIYRHLIKYKTNIDKDSVLLLPLSLYYNFSNEIIAHNFLSIICFNGFVYGKGINEIKDLLNKRHGADFKYNVVSEHIELELALLGLRPLTTGLALMAGVIILVIILGLSGLMTAVVKKNRKAICIRQCIGVKRYLIVTEILLVIAIPCVVAGILGMYLNDKVITILTSQTDEVFRVFTLLNSQSHNYISLGVVCIPSLIAGVLSVWRIYRLEPMETLRKAD